MPAAEDKGGKHAHTIEDHLCVKWHQTTGRGPNKWTGPYRPGNEARDIVQLCSIMWWENEPDQLLTKAKKIREKVCAALATNEGVGASFKY